MSHDIDNRPGFDYRSPVDSFSSSSSSTSSEESPASPSTVEATKVSGSSPEATTVADDDEKAFSCSICLQPYSVMLTKQSNAPVMLTACQHVFCLACISRHVEEVKPCPKCRREMDEQRPYTVLYF